MFVSILVVDLGAVMIVVSVVDVIVLVIVIHAPNIIVRTIAIGINLLVCVAILFMLVLF